MIARPDSKYAPATKVRLPHRTWPEKAIVRAPIWCSSDLRDGNQALVNPMDPRRKRRLFEMLVEVGFKQIEVAFPAASQPEYDFVRSLIEEDLIPPDVTIQVITPSRDDLILRTFEALRGAPRVILQFYNATAEPFRQLVFRRGQDAVRDIAVHAADLVQRCAAAQPHTEWTLQYGVEAFNATELEFAKSICDAVTAVWQPTPERKVIVNLPSTVELATPNVFADQIEWMNDNLDRRESIILSVHPHNDRGTGVASAELAIMAGAERIEGCLFGNGERSGNVDLVTLALNLYTQGVSPGLDFSDIDSIRHVAEMCTGMPVHARHPYAGDLVFTSFAGAHQDAISKGLAARKATDRWTIPYLPIDPADVGRSYNAVIRVNSQSGKGGTAHLLATGYGLRLPRPLQIEMSERVQRVTDASGKEIRADEIHEILRREYANISAPRRLLGHSVERDGATVDVRLELDCWGSRELMAGSGCDLVHAALDAVCPTASVVGQDQHWTGPGDGALSASYVELRMPDGDSAHGVGLDLDESRATLLAVVSALNRLLARDDDASEQAIRGTAAQGR
jgi:2-isopropylmalate synthase